VVVGRCEVCRAWLQRLFFFEELRTEEPLFFGHLLGLLVVDREYHAVVLAGAGRAVSRLGRGGSEAETHAFLVFHVVVDERPVVVVASVRKDYQAPAATSCPN